MSEIKQLKHYFNILILNLALAACKQNTSNTTEEKPKTPVIKESPDKIQDYKRKLTYRKHGFRKVEDVVNDKDSHPWFDFKNDSKSLALYFNLSYKDMISVSYSPECWLMYPYKIDGDKIIVYWDVLVDSKYNFDITKAINKVDKKHIGKPFIILNLLNDTTLQANYPIPNLVKSINSSSSHRTFFTDRFILSNEF